MHKRTAILFLLLCVPFATLLGQEADVVHTLYIHAGGGFTRNVSDFDVVPEGLDRSGMFGTVRLMWKPEHLLSFGLEAGYQRIYAVNITNAPSPVGPISGNSVLNAIPVLLIFSMPVIDHFEAYVGGGFGFLHSTVEFLGDETISSAYTPALMAAGSYFFPLSDDISLGGELRYVYYDRFVDQNIGVQVLLSYRLTSW